MRFLLFIPLLSLLLFSCNKEKKEADYIIAVSGSDYADDLRIAYRFGTEAYNTLSLSNGEAVISAIRKFRLELVCAPYSQGDNPSAPQHQTEGDKLNFKVYQSKKGKRGDQVAEGSLTISNISSENQEYINIEW